MVSTAIRQNNSKEHHQFNHHRQDESVPTRVVVYKKELHLPSTSTTKTDSKVINTTIQPATSWGIAQQQVQPIIDKEKAPWNINHYHLKRRHTIHSWSEVNSNESYLHNYTKQGPQSWNEQKKNWKDESSAMKNCNNIKVNKRRISKCLKCLRAASERSQVLRDYQTSSLSSLNHSCSSFDTQSEEENSSKWVAASPTSIRDLVGDLGLTLFSPLDLEAFESLPDLIDDKYTAMTIIAGKAEIPSLSDENSAAIEILPESDPSILSSCPRLLSRIMMKELSNALPETISQTMVWDRIFAIGRDGDCFDTFQQKCRSYNHTIIVVEEASLGFIFGGYAASSWNRDQRREQGEISKGPRSFFGTGSSFLFANHTMSTRLNDGDDNNYGLLNIYPWTGKNFDFQFCDEIKGSIAMGSNSDNSRNKNYDSYFGFYIQDNFTRGFIGNCSTFDNPQLIPRHSTDGESSFEITNFEVYGFSSLADTFLKK